MQIGHSSLASARRHRLPAARLGCAVALAFVLGSAAAAYPEKPVKLVIPYPPGGATA